MAAIFDFSPLLTNGDLQLKKILAALVMNNVLLGNNNLRKAARKFEDDVLINTSGESVLKNL